MTIYDIAKELNVSAATVSLALNGDPRVAEKTRIRIRSFAAEHGFERDEQARNFRLRRSNNIAIIVHNIDNDFWYGIVRAVEQGLGDGFNVILCNTEGSLEKERKIFANLVRRKVDGIIVQPASTEEAHFLETIRAGIPVVSLEKTEHEQISFVKGNDHLAAFRLTEESIRRGHRDIAFLNFRSDSIGLEERVSGFLEAVDRHHLQNRCKVLSANNISTEAIAELISGHEEDFSLYLCSDDRLACLLLQELERAHIPVPERISVCGWNDCRFLEYLTRPLSSVAIPMAEIGNKAAGIIREYLEKGPCVHKFYIEEKIILRDSFRSLAVLPQTSRKEL